MAGVGQINTIVYTSCSGMRRKLPRMDERSSEVSVWLLPRWTQQDWMSEGVCGGQTELFFPPPAERPQSRLRRETAARAVCEQCPVVVECRTYEIGRAHV